MAESDVPPFGPGVVDMSSDPPMVTGTGSLHPGVQQMCEIAARYLRLLDGATTTDGAIFVLGRFADSLEAVGAAAEDDVANLRAALREARDADPRRRAKAWLNQRTFDAATKAYEAAGWVRDQYRDRYGDDRWDDY